MWEEGREGGYVAKPWRKSIWQNIVSVIFLRCIPYFTKWLLIRAVVSVANPPKIVGDDLQGQSS